MNISEMDPRHPRHFWDPTAPKYRGLPHVELRFLQKRSQRNTQALMKTMQRAKKGGGVVYLLSNFNGTLRSIEENLAPGVRETLSVFADAGNPVWIFSGESVGGVVQDTRLSHIGYVGCNGAEQKAPGATSSTILELAKVYQDNGPTLWSRLAQGIHLAGLGKGVVLNPLPVGCKIEFFGVNPEQRARIMQATVDEVIRPLIQMTGWVVGPGTNVLTIRLPSEMCSKVEAVMSVLPRHFRKRDVVIYAGDSTKTGGDLPVFIALQRALRLRGTQLYCVSVEEHITPLALTRVADLSVWRAPGYGNLLAEIATA